MKQGPSVRTRRNHAIYMNYLSNKDAKICDFCGFHTEHKEVQEELDYFWIVINPYGYQIWDECRVEEHLLLIPKRHIHSLSELTTKEMVQYTRVISEREENGYSVFTRPMGGKTRSVLHLHTHLIKTSPKLIRWIFFLRKPHMLWFW